MTNRSSASSRSCCSRLMPALSPSFKSGRRSSLGTCSNTIGGSSVKERWRYYIMIRSLRSLSHQERKTIAGHRLQGIDDGLPEPSDPERIRALIVGSRQRCQQTTERLVFKSGCICCSWCGKWNHLQTQLLLFLEKPHPRVNFGSRLHVFS